MSSARPHPVRSFGLKAAAALGTGALIALAAPLAASAHVTVSPSGTAAGSYSVLTFAFSHGCDGSPTTALAFTIPDEVESVTPTLHTGWDISEGDSTIIYTAKTPVPDHRRDTIELSVLLPQGSAGDTVAFPVLQTCETGSTDWSEIAADGAAEPESPAPTVTLSASTGDAHGHGHGDASDDESEEHQHSDSDQHSDAATSSLDPVARWFGIGGLALGAGALVTALLLRRRTAETTEGK